MIQLVTIILVVVNVHQGFAAMAVASGRLLMSAQIHTNSILVVVGILNVVLMFTLESIKDIVQVTRRHVLVALLIGAIGGFGICVRTITDV